MRITKVEALHVGQFMFARVSTDEGIVGVGESGAWGQLEASAAAIRRFAQYLEGKDPFDIEHHWNVMHRFGYFQGIAINSAISAIDIALWDIKGKALNVPIYQLLGGPVRTKARIYGHIYESSIEKILVECKAKMEAGFTAFGHLNPFLDEGNDQVYFKTHIKKMRDAIDNVHRMREVVGDRVDLLIELHRRLTPAEAVVFARGIEDTHPMFIEDPIRPEGPDGMTRVAGKIHIPIATGERFTSIYEFQALLSRNSVEYARVDPCVCGGITGARKVAAMAEAHHVQVVPHNPLSPIGLAACLQLDAAIPNFAIQEYATGFEAGIFESRPEHLGTNIVDQVPLPLNGFVDIPTGPGLGMNLVPDAQKIRPPLSRPISMRPHLDGFVVDQ
ncbi:mandelate racemase/muconate lactonizing enzyme family protein [Cupriavidus sp. CuC1]|uniref:mandelate racemase/muconate lactonizing enzyme family protein n=1 Tax=Cupriavidus TaxID=106589 RepID=UPI00296B1A60|nr:mandelate racemase/muconate lactonizing enzyme family protein [Cupriavidus sp. CV2]MDW3688800.1 mandelate racemase/muconate lactonizing enzyme family protein [Cupriavidus sp. CV2]